MSRIKSGDLVQVISGPRQDRGGDRGKQGRVLSVLGDRVVVEGVNLATKHVRVGQTQRGTKTGGIEHVEAPIHISNVALVDPDTKAPARVGSAFVGGEKQRVYKKSRYVAKPTKSEKSEKSEKSDKPAKKSTAKPSAEAAETATEEN